MTPVGKALWYIEIQLSGELTLDDIARASGMSRFAISRLFAIATGWSVMRYVRARRLTRAAQTLVEHAPGILTVALDAGYGSHEAFTRAFADGFGLTPERLRDRRTLDGLRLVEPLRMKDVKFIDLDAWRSRPCSTRCLSTRGISPCCIRRSTPSGISGCPPRVWTQRMPPTSSATAKISIRLPVLVRSKFGCP
jgi:AraC family transcriptional regulator